MTIDERLEALTQTVELIAHAQIKSDERVAKLTEDIVKLTGHMAETGGFINRLAHIA